jgi:hypothetical protein
MQQAIEFGLVSGIQNLKDFSNFLVSVGEVLR